MLPPNERLTIGSVAAATRGKLQSGSADTRVTGFSIDSRAACPGDLFFAIEAARDGHAFVLDALTRSAGGAVVRRWPLDGVQQPASSAQGIVQVEDTTRALQDLARHVRRRSGAIVVAITGSVGKTTTKEAIAAVLEARFRVMRNAGNLNNHLGLPLSLLTLAHTDTHVAVVELGMNHAGEIRVLVGVAEPQIRVWTNVGQAHLGHFDSVDAIADAKAELLEGATSQDALICSADDPRIMVRAKRFEGTVITFGETAGATVRALDIEDQGTDGTRARIVTPKGERTLQVPLVGRGNLQNALCAVAVGVHLGVNLDDIVERVGALVAPPGRGRVSNLAGRIRLVDDSYNSSPSALRQVLEAVGLDRRASRKGAVLGEMLELGPRSHALHEECGRIAASAGLARLITVGGDPARALGESAIRAGLPRDSVTHVMSSAQAAAQVLAWLEPGDLLLVKGSRGIRTDVVIEQISAELA